MQIDSCLFDSGKKDVCCCFCILKGIMLYEWISYRFAHICKTIPRVCELFPCSSGHMGSVEPGTGGQSQIMLQAGLMDRHSVEAGMADCNSVIEVAV